MWTILTQKKFIIYILPNIFTCLKIHEINERSRNKPRWNHLSRECCPIFATGFFCQNDSLMGELLWQKDSLVTLILFELCICLFWYLAQLKILGNSLYWIPLKETKVYPWFLRWNIQKTFYFFIYIFPSYVAHEITKEFLKNSHLKIWRLISFWGVKTHLDKK